MNERGSGRIWWYSLAGAVIICGMIGLPRMIDDARLREVAEEKTEGHLARKEYAQICRLLEHDDPEVVSQVAGEFYDLDTYPVSEDLVVALGKNLNRFATHEGALQCAVALHHMGRNGVDLLPALESLDEALSHPDREVRRSTANALCTIRDAKVLPSVERILAWRDEIDLPARLTEALANIDSPDVYPLLYLCLERSSLQLGAKLALEGRLGVRIDMPAQPTEQEIQGWIEDCERARKRK